MSETPLHDELEARFASLADDRAVILSARETRALVEEARYAGEATIEAWMKAVDASPADTFPCPDPSVDGR